MTKYRVHIVESERGWGRKIEDTKYFDTAEEAEQFIKTYNAKNPPLVNGRAPDWYMQAEGPYKAP
jgi:hypothetical protein